MKLPTKKKTIELDMRKYKVLVYGSPKAGKTTWASHAEDAIFIPTEPGINFVECFTITDDDGNPKVCTQWKDFKDAVKILCTTDHQFKTVVIDTIDNAHKLCSQYVRSKRGIEHESDEGYGKGWTLVKEEFETLINRLCSSGMGVIFVSHEKETEREEKSVKYPYTDNTLGNGPKKYINGLVDFIFYAYMNDDGDRHLRTKATKNINAGDRTGKLPEVMPLSYSAFRNELKKALSPSKEKK